MRGPEQFHQGGVMEKKTNPREKNWSEEDKKQGDDILFYIKKNIDTNNVADKHAQASKAAKALGLISDGETFKDLKPSIKSYLEYIWWLDTDEGKDYLLRRDLKEIENNWFKDPNNKALVGPEEEHLLEAFEE